MKFRMQGWLATATLLTACVLGAACAASAQDEGPTASVKFTVLRDTDGKPLRNAAVVLHPVKSKGKQAAGEIELKTDADGIASVEGIPYGVLRVQVLAPKFQTFGDDYEINKPQLEITVKMKHWGAVFDLRESRRQEAAVISNDNL